jgi:hypothetical protein
VREAVASGDKTKLRPALVLLWASQHLDNLWRLESHLGRDAFTPWSGIPGAKVGLRQLPEEA